MGFSQGQHVGAGGLPLKQKLLESDNSAGWSPAEVLPPSVFVLAHRWGMPHVSSFKGRFEGSYTSWSVILQAREDGRCTLRSGNSWFCVCLHAYMCVPACVHVCTCDVFQTLINIFSSYFFLILDPFSYIWLAVVRRKKCHIEERKGSCFLPFGFWKHRLGEDSRPPWWGVRRILSESRLCRDTSMCP